jgi:Ca2+-binding EF-hand superfamily protein
MKAALLGLMIPAALALPAMAEQGPRGNPAMIFERLDADRDGAVTLAELEAMRAARFAERDANGDGRLDRDELLAGAAQRAKRGVDRMMGRLDADGDGAITADEFADAGRPGADPARLVGRFDTDGDGALSLPEFEAGLAEVRAHRGMRGGGVGHGPERG